MTDKTLDRCTTAEPAQANAPARRITVVPRADAWETEEAAHLDIELPGVTHDDIELRIENDRLVVSAVSASTPPEGRPRRIEWRPTGFRRAFVLSDDADRDAIDARLRNGLLSVTIPRRAEKRPRSIPVRTDAT